MLLELHSLNIFMAIGTLYIANVNHDWNQHDSILIDSNNLNKLIKDINKHDCHTSVNDIGYIGLHTIFNNCDYVNVDFLTSDDSFKAPTDVLLSYGRLLNELYRNQHKVLNFDQHKFFLNPTLSNLVDAPKSSEMHLWCAGCSVTVGCGVETEQSWPTLLANKLNLPLVRLAMPGRSIEWAADQILRSDIKSGDIVVWGLSNITRVDIVKSDWLLVSAPITEYTELSRELQYWTPDYFDSKTSMTKQLHSVMQVINFCNKIGAKLYLANMLDTNWLAPTLSVYDNFIDLTHGLQIQEFGCKFIDYGNDNAHPGPQQHQQYTDILYKLINK